MLIQDFINDRLNEAELRTKSDPNLNPTIAAEYMVNINLYRWIVEWHKNWPVLVRSEPELTIEELAPGIESVHYKLEQKIVWTTNEEYIRNFGDAPPTAPILARIAREWCDHEDYDMAWWIDG